MMCECRESIRREAGFPRKSVSKPDMQPTEDSHKSWIRAILGQNDPLLEWNGYRTYKMTDYA